MSVNAGVAPVDVTTSVGMVRTLLGDSDPIPLDPDVTGQGEYRYWSDAELTAIIAMFAYDTRVSALMRVAIWCLRQIAASQALLLKSWTSDDLAVNGPAITEAIRKVAADLEGAADAADLNDADSTFTITPTNTDNFNWIPEGTPFPWASDVLGVPASPYWHTGVGFWGQNWWV